MFDDEMCRRIDEAVDKIKTEKNEAKWNGRQTNDRDRKSVV